MILGGGVPQKAIDGAGDALARGIEFVDHIWHELEGGDVMTWVAFLAMAFVVTVFVGVWRGTVTFSKGGK